MKHLKFLFPVLLCTLLLGFSSCKETNADRLRAMRGDWKSVKNRPAFAGENQVTKEEMTAFYREETETHRYLKEYDGFDARQLRKMTHLEKIDGKYLLFDYRNRSRLSQNAATYEVCFSNE